MMSDDKIKLIRDAHEVFKTDLESKIESEQDEKSKDVYEYLIAITNVAFANYIAIEDIYMQISDIQTELNKSNTKSGQ